MEYEVVIDTSLKSVIEEVKQLMENGWKPQGGISVIESKFMDGSNTYAQAMVKES